MRLIKRAFLLLAVAGLTGSVSCVSPFYGTARIEKGFNVDAGIAVMSEITPSMDSWAPEYSPGIRADCSIRYGISRFFQLNGRATLGGAAAWPPILIDASVGVQTAVPIGPITPALQLDLSGYSGGPTLSPGFLLGIGRKEWLTLGARIHIPGNWYDNPHPEYGPYIDPYPIDVFAGIHIGKWNVFAGSQMFRHSYNKPTASIGFGYTFGPYRKKWNDERKVKP